MSAFARRIRNALGDPLDPSRDWRVNSEAGLALNLTQATLSGVGLWEPIERLSFLGSADSCRYVSPLRTRLPRAVFQTSDEHAVLKFPTQGIDVEFDAYGWIREYFLWWRPGDSKRLVVERADGTAVELPWETTPYGVRMLLPEFKLHHYPSMDNFKSCVMRMNRGERSWFMHFDGGIRLDSVWCTTGSYQPTADWHEVPELRLSVFLDTPSINGVSLGAPIVDLAGLGKRDEPDITWSTMRFPGQSNELSSPAAAYRAKQRAKPIENVFAWKDWGLQLAFSKAETFRGFRILPKRARGCRERLIFYYRRQSYRWDELDTIEKVSRIFGIPDWRESFVRRYPERAALYTRHDGCLVFQYDGRGRTVAIEGREFPWQRLAPAAADSDDSIYLEPLDQTFREDDWGTGVVPARESHDGITVISAVAGSRGDGAVRVKTQPPRGVIW